MSNYKPPFVVIDFETVELLSDGTQCASTEFYRPSFRVASCAFSYRGRSSEVVSHFTQGEAETLYFLERLVDGQIPLVAHNVQFEMGVLLCRFTGLAKRVLWEADTMRLIQQYDNGGDEFALDKPVSLDEQLDALENPGEEARPKSLAGLGLSKAVQRILHERDHKSDTHTWIRLNVPECREGQEGRYLHRLPPDLLRRYNVADTEVTLRLYEHLVSFFQSIKFNWQFDHALYLNSVKLIVGAKIRGVAVERSRLASNRDAVSQEITEIEEAFRHRFDAPIKAVERGRLLVEIRKRKTLRGRKGFLKRVRMDPEYHTEKVGFNVGSNQQLSALFIDQLGVQPKFRTDKGAPSFKSACLSQYGEGGDMLKTRRKRMLVLKQQESLLELSEYDGRWHCDLRAAGCATGRFSGGQHA